MNRPVSNQTFQGESRGIKYLRSSSVLFRRRAVLLALFCGVILGPYAAAEEHIFEPSPDSEFDWIQLDSGEWLKGDLKVMYDQSLEFDSDKMDLQDFDFEDVIRIRTHNVQRILVEPAGQESEVITGTVEMDQGRFIITHDGETQEVDRWDVVAIAQRAEHERDHWSGSLSVGFNLRGGNSETIDANVSANLKRQTVLTRYNIDYLANYSATYDSETANNQRLSGDANLFLSPRFYWRVLEGELYRDVFINIDRQYSLHSGGGYYLARTPKTEWSVGAALGYQQTKYLSVQDNSDLYSESPYFGAGTMLDYELNNHVDYLLDYSFRLLNESNGRYTHHLVTTLSMDLIADKMDLDVSLVWDRVKEPTPDSDGKVPDPDDFQLIFSLTFDF